MQVKDIFLLVSGELQDLGAEKRWPWELTPGRVSLVDLMNAAVREIALNRPDATAVTEAIRLEPGGRQIIPSVATHGASRDSLCLLELVQNMGADGETPGEPVFRVERSALAAADWTLTTAGDIDEYAYDKTADPNVYLVHPAVAADATIYVEATYSAEPVAVTGPEDAFPLGATFAGPARLWMLWEIMSGDNSEANFVKAQTYLKAFYQALGVKLKADLFFPVKVAKEGM